MKRYVLLSVLLLGSLWAQGQVTFRARVFLPGGKSVSGIWASLRMIVEGEDTARFAPSKAYDNEIDTLTGSVCFTGITRGARCYLYMSGMLLECYDYPVFTINEDMTVDSLVLRKVEERPRLYWCRAVRDSAMHDDVAALGGDPMARDTHWYDYGNGHEGYWLDDETHALRLARIYYKDWGLPIASWRTFPHAADSAYRYALMAYDRKKTPWLYPVLQQLHRYLGLPDEPKVRKPKAPKVRYLPPLAEEALSDTTLDLFSTQRRARWLSDFLGKVLPEFGEPSLCCPVAEEGTLRYMVWSPWGYVSVLRLQGRRLYVNRASGWPTDKMKLEASDEFDLGDSQLAEVRRLMDAFIAAKLPDDLTGVVYVIDGGDYMLEYIHDGEYRTFRVPDGGQPKEFKSLAEYLWGLYKARHESE
ncbi:MAG: hypothetical protein IJ634_04445 [Bacteroidales bacterium]|nr:hypothetical protein [Bacteroidales bacterium]